MPLLHLTPGCVRTEHLGEFVKNGFAGTLSKGTLVYISAASTRVGTEAVTRVTAPTVTKADANGTAPANVALYVVLKDIPQDGYGLVGKKLLLDADTSGYGAEGAIGYLSETAGATTATEPTAAASTSQPVGHVVGTPSATGQFLYDLTLPAKRVGGVVSGATVSDTVFGAVGAHALTAAEFGVPVQLVLEHADIATGNVDYTGCPYKLFVTNVETTQVGAGNAGNSITVHNGTTGNAITDAMNNATANGTDQAATLDPTHRVIAAGATIRVAVVKAGGASSAKVIISALRIA